jgi:hypothetical protein
MMRIGGILSGSDRVRRVHGERLPYLRALRERDRRHDRSGERRRAGVDLTSSHEPLSQVHLELGASVRSASRRRVPPALQNHVCRSWRITHRAGTHRPDSPEQHTCVRDGIHRAFTCAKPGMDAVWGPQMGPQAAEIPRVYWFSNRSPRYSSPFPKRSILRA